MFDAILLIAGKGERTKLTYNKIFYKVKGKPLFYYPLKTFLSCEECEKVIVVTTVNEINEVKNEIVDFDLSRIDFTFGGEMRQDSVEAGIKLCTNDVVLIHDGARPLITKSQILEIYENVKKYSSVVLAVKTVDTIREIKNNQSITLDRKNLWNIQTPQGVNLKLYQEALQKAKSDNYYGTDDVGLLEKYLNIFPKIVEGSYQNIKVTTKSDLEYIEFLIGGKNYGL